jgi:molybdenum cofactor cytidylyltransferase
MLNLEVGGVVLASGRASRFGSAKLQALFRGKPLLAHVLETVARARSAGDLLAASAVVPADDAGLVAIARGAGIDTLLNPEPDAGLAESLRIGLRGLGQDEKIGAALVFLGDQPLVRLDVIRALVAAWRQGQGTLVRPRYSAAPDSPGHPVLVDRSLWTAAERLQDDAGFGSLFPPGSRAFSVLDVNGSNPDIDTPTDLHLLEGSPQ